MKNYCFFCDAEEMYSIKEEVVETKIKGSLVRYLAKVPICNKCGNEIYIAEMDDQNIEEANRQYRFATGLITTNEIEKLLEKYNIGKKPLSKLLGWGEVTILRYLEGKMPTKEYSDKLLSLNDPLKMLDLYNLNRDVLTSTASSKLKKKLDKLLGLDYKETDEITFETIANYFLNKIDNDIGICITPLKLQKLVYYAQAWFLAFHKKPLFQKEICAWVHGPVIDSLYYKYQSYGYRNIERLEKFDVSILGIEEISVLEDVWNVYGKFEAKYLESLTHHELPWNHAREGYDESERCNEPISKDKMMEYYSNLKETYHINSTEELEAYVRSININWNKPIMNKH